MKKTVKTLIVMLLALMMVIGLVSCDVDDPANIDTTTDSNSGTTEPSDDTTTADDGDGTTEPSDGTTTVVDIGTTSGVADTTPTVTTAPAEPIKETTYNLTSKYSKYVKMIGRAAFFGNGVQCDHTASGIELSVCVQEAGPLAIEITSTNSSGTAAVSYFTVFVDGVRQDRYMISSGKGRIRLNNLSEGDHNIRVLKQTESINALATINSVTFKGTLNDKPADRDLYIEILGDSVSVGYGNLILGNNYTNPNNTVAGSPEYQDGTLAFPFLTAEKLNADVSVIGRSGIGLMTRTPNITDYYTRNSYYRSADRMFSFANARVPDIIVMDLAQNDYNDGRNGSTVAAAAKTFIEETRRLYGEDVIIIWTHDMNGGCFSTEIKQMIAGLGGASNGLYTLQLPSNFDGGNNHPSKEGHEAAATVLANFIRENILR